MELIYSCIYLLLISHVNAVRIASLKNLRLDHVDSEIYDKPQLYLKTDSKSYVDMVTNVPYEVLIAELFKHGQIQESKKTKTSVKFNFTFPDVANKDIADLSSHIPEDFTDILLDLSFNESPRAKYLLDCLNLKWPELSKKALPLKNAYSTLIDTKIPFFAPGGRFKEFYYWDSYWILLGLLRMKMYISAENLVKNFVFMINKYGFIPNGSRKYYTNRSQPPMFTQMLYLLLQYDFERYKDFVMSKGIGAAIEEYEWFEEKKKTEFFFNGQLLALNQYKVSASHPRLESFIHDYIVFEYLKKYQDSPSETDFYSHIHTAAESGWDFSTRWLLEDKHLYSIHTTDMIHVDLNALLYRNEVIISKILLLKGDFEQSAKFKNKSNERALLINKVLWNPKRKIWNDYDTKARKYTDKRFYFSNIMPLLYGISPPDNTNPAEILTEYSKELFGYVGGIPTGGETISSQQWDYPNVWAPHQSMMVNYLLDKGHRNLAVHVARTFFENAFAAYIEKNVFYEKYDCNRIGMTGNEGEYLPQTGFGWTNGTLIDFIYEFYKEFNSEFDHQESYKLVLEYLKTINN